MAAQPDELGRSRGQCFGPCRRKAATTVRRCSATLSFHQEAPVVAHIPRTVLAALALVLGTVVAQAQLPPPEQRVPAPDRHPATGLVFPAQIGNAQKARSIDYGKTVNQPGL